MGELMRSHDWGASPLGVPENWPQSLKTAISIMLDSGFAMVVCWGPEFHFFYNDRYRPVLGKSKHPGALGRPAKEIFPEAWPFIGPLFDSTRRGETVALDDILIPLDRNGYLENCYFTLSYSPIRDETGDVGGMLAVVAETTERVEGERRLKTLRDLARRASETKTLEAAYAEAAATLSENSADIPFALLYGMQQDGTSLHLRGSAGVEANTTAAPEDISLIATSGWPLAQSIKERRSMVLDDLPIRFGALPGGPYPELTHTAIVHPLIRGQQPADGVLVFGISPRRALDDQYRGFYELAADHILTGIRNAVAYQEEKQRAEALAELDRAKTAFFSNVSHEFRTPLTLMLGPVEDALSNVTSPLPDEQRIWIEVLHRNGLRLLKLVNTLLDFSRIEAGRMEAVYEATDLSSYTADLISVFRSAIERAGLRLSVNCPALPEPIFIDREMWEKIVLNLLSNALKFTFEGEIVVTLRWAASHVEFEVSDTGTGIPKKDLPHLFERFYRVREAKGRSYEGSGIGLALVQELVRLHGGTITVSSELGKGTTFLVTIPTGSGHLPADRIRTERRLASTALGAAPYVEEALRWLPSDKGLSSSDHSDLGLTEPKKFLRRSGDGPSARILVADDNADMKEYLERLLSAKYQIETVADGELALAAVRQNPPDLILSDVMMPGVDGFGLVRALRSDALTKMIPIILLSARAGEESRVEGMEVGADDYLVKPFGARELLARVEAHLQIARIRNAAAMEREQLLALEKDARAKAEAANRLKDEFLATVSHELRTPLNAILGWVQLLQTGNLDQAGEERALETVARNARTQNQLIEDLLDVSRIITGKLRLDVRQVDVASIIESAAEVVRPTAENRGVRLQMILDPHAGPVSADPARLQQVLWNLMSNAIKFTPKGGRVMVKLERINSHVEITVTDNGVGVPPEFLPYLFERFRQADGSPSRAYGGLGLGLAIVKHLVELHGGTVRAESLGEGLGATFVVSLPLITILKNVQPAEDVHPTAGSALPFEPSPLLEGLKVLVVDDEPDGRELVAEVLRQCSASVITAASAAEAFVIVNREELDVIVADIEMPQEDGYAFLRKVRALESDGKKWIPAAALTAYARTEDRHRALTAGYQIHIPKPAEPAELVAVVASLGRLHRRSEHSR